MTDDNQQLDRYADRTSARAWWANQFRLLVHRSRRDEPGSVLPRHVDKQWGKGGGMSATPGVDQKLINTAAQRPCRA